MDGQICNDCLIIFLPDWSLVSPSGPVPHHPRHAGLLYDLPSGALDPSKLLRRLRLVVRRQPPGPPPAVRAIGRI